MKYTDRVLKHPLFVNYTERIRELEKDRIYCGHQLEHSMDVARLAWIYYMEDMLSDTDQVGHFFAIDQVYASKEDSEGEELDVVWQKKCEMLKDLFYTCALLHDIGRAVQYETGVHHSIAGQELARQVLEDVQAPASWLGLILDVVAEHSHGEFSEGDRSLEYYIMKADHDCRLCFGCQASDSCKWSDEEMNHSIIS